MDDQSRPGARPSLAEVAARLEAETVEASPGDSRRPEPPRPSLAEVAARLEAETATEDRASPAPAAEATAARPAPKATRRGQDALLGGVCAGIAAHLGVPVLVVRTAFVVLGAFELLGALLYAALWLVMPAEVAERSPGVDAASRRGMRAETSHRGVDIGQLLALLLVGVGLSWFVRSLDLGITGATYWPLLVGGLGAALIWRQTDGIAVRDDRRSLASWLQIMLGVVLVGAGVVIGISQVLGWAHWRVTVWTSLVAVVGVLAVYLPWGFRTRSALSAAREQELVAHARADVAAHLHDSVLQTLALIQKQADDPRAVAALARRQERELRDWLYGEGADAAQTFRAALRRSASEVEDDRGVPIDLVVVGDLPLTPQLDALVRATREAVLNAAKHSGADRVDVYAEVGDGFVEVFVRDRGVGFDMDAVGEDRMGVRRSIMGRMARNAGTARVRTAPGEGTEVRLEMELP